MGVAVAAPPGAAKAKAPYAQAAAEVNANGSVNRSKGIESVTKPAVGQYCVELEDKDLDITKLVPTATMQLYTIDHDVQISSRRDAASAPFPRRRCDPTAPT